MNELEAVGDATPPQDKPATSAPLSQLVPVFLIALGQAILLHWKMLSHVYRFHDNWRQVPHWANKSRTSFQPDDLTLRYSEFNTAPFENFLYQSLARLGPDILWGKLTPLLFYALTAALVYMTAYAMRGRFGGIVATTIFMCFPSSFTTFVGGFSSGMSMPLLCLAMLFVFRKSWWAFIPLMLAQVFVYPMVAIHTGVLLIVDTLVHDARRIKDPSLWKNKMLPLIISAGIVIVAVGSKYVLADHGFGELTGRELIGDRPEFGQDGRAYLTPIPSIFPGQIGAVWGNAFHVTLFAAAFILLGRRMFRLPRGLWSLFGASVILYLLADLMLIRLYYPDRYLHRSFPLLIAFAGATWMCQIRQRGSQPIANLHPLLRPLGSAPRWSVLALVLILLGSWAFKSRLIPPGKSQGVSFDRLEIYEAIRALPGRPMIAAPPLLCELPLVTGKTIFVSKESAHPWWTEYWEVMYERHDDYFRAYFGSDADFIRDVTLKHEIDYWLIDRWHFTADTRPNPKYDYFQPFNDLIHNEIRSSADALFMAVPPDLLTWDSRRYFIVSRENLLAWLETKGSTQ